MTAGVLVYGHEGNFNYAHKTWNFTDVLDCDFVFSISEGVTSELAIQENFPNSKFIRTMDLDGSDSEKNLTLIKNGYKLFDKDYDLIILIKINCYVIAENGFEFLLNCNKEERIYGYRPIKIIGKQLFYVPDYFFIGNKKNMDILINNLPETIETDIYDVIPKILLQNELYIEDIGPYFNIEEVYNNIFNTKIKLSLHELKIKAVEWKQKR